MLSCLTFSSSFSFSFLFLIPSSYSGLSRISMSLHFSCSMRCCNPTFLAISTLSEPQMLLSCVSRPRSSCMGKSSDPSNCVMRFSVLVVALFVSSRISVSSAFVISGAEGNSHSASFNFMASASVSCHLTKLKLLSLWTPMGALNKELNLTMSLKFTRTAGACLSSHKLSSLVN